MHPCLFSASTFPLCAFFYYNWNARVKCQLNVKKNTRADILDFGILEFDKSFFVIDEVMSQD